MTDLNSSTSLSSAQLAHSFVIPTPNPIDSDDVELRILYDPFAPEEVEVHQLVYEDGKTLGEYIGELDPEQTWMIFHNGEEVMDLEASKSTPVSKTDSIGILLIPQGGDGFKSVLRIVMQAAAVALAFVPGIGWAAALAINVAIGLANAFLLTPKPPKTADQDQEDRAYGIDGAKNSSTENIPYPVIYGEYRVAGNFSDVYTLNQGDDQYLFLRTVLNDGLIESVSDVEVNEQPMGNFKAVQSRVALGSLDQPSNDWFRRSIVQVNKSTKLTTAWAYHTTTDEVDKLRFDVAFTQGLVKIDEEKGTYNRHSVEFECEYREIDPVTGQPIGGGASWTPGGIVTPLDDYANGLTGVYGTAGVSIGRATIEADVSTYAAENPGSDPKIQYKKESSSEWLDLPAPEIPTGTESDRFIYDGAGDGTISGPTNVSPGFSIFRDVDLEDDAYEFRGVGGATVTAVTIYPTSGQQRFAVGDRRTRQIRKSFETERLNRGYYETRIRRTTATSTDKYILDEVFLTDVGEISLDNIRLSGVANLSLKIKLSDQLSQIPTLSAKVKGCILQEYDRYGNPTVKRWSANPAWIALDILIGEERGAGYPVSRIDWPEWVELAEYCDNNNITYNGVFVSKGSLGEAYREVMRVGHSMAVPMGTKMSVAIDKPRNPVMLFGDGNILEKTLSTSYLSLKDRSNDFEVQYFDKNDGNKQKTIRYVDPKAVAFNEVPRKASVTLKGVDNIEQARAELWRMVYSNRLLLRTVTLDAPLEAIGLKLGDVAMVEASAMRYSFSGRIKSRPNIHKFVVPEDCTMEAGSDYKVLLHVPAVKRSSFDRTVSSVAGNTILLDASEGPLSFNEENRADRLVKGADEEDRQIVSIAPGASFHTVTLESPPESIVAGSKVSIWQIDHIFERDVISVTDEGDGTKALNLDPNGLSAPSEAVGCNYVFGKNEIATRPMALTGISGEGIEKRTLTFADYDERIYDAGEVDIPIPTIQVTDRNVVQVRNLLLDYENVAEANRNVLNVRLHWDSSQILNYGGADIYVSLNGMAFRRVGTAGGASEFQMQAAPGDEVIARVVPFNMRGDRASYALAKTVSATLSVEFADLQPPTNVIASSVAFQVDGTIEVSFDPPAVSTGIREYEFQYKRSVDMVWISAGYQPSGPFRVSGLPTGTYDVRVRASSPTSTSTWVSDEVTVVVLPGSLLANWNSSNDRNSDPVVDPSLPASGVIDHTLNSDGSANVSFEWEWAGDEADIDGFIVTIEDDPPA